MSTYTIKKAAEDFDISFTAALKMRMRYVVQQLDKGIDWMLDESSMPDIMPGEAINELISCNKGLLESKIKPSANTVTPEMIEKARQVPVDSLIEFIRGSARCFAHEDKSPSMYFGSRTNTAQCPVCNKHWDSIQILKERDGLTFHEAIRKLCLQ
jgi:hypothetical protein